MRQLLTLAWPMIVSRSTQSVIGLSDALLITHLGGAELAAVTAGALNAFATMIFPMGIVFIVSSFSSQLAGRRDFTAARRYGWYGLGVAAAAELLAVGVLPALRPALHAMGYSPGVVEAFHAYLVIRLLSTGPAVGIEALGNYYGGLGNTAILMRANVAAMVLNVALNILLIDGRCGFPALGVRGSALASLLATLVAFIGFLAAFLRHGRGFRAPRLRWREFGRMMRFGLPSGFNWAFEFFAFVLFVNLVVGGLGTVSLAAMMTVFQVGSVSFLPAFGLASAGAILVGQAIGAGRQDRVANIVRLTARTAVTWMGIIGLVFWFQPRLVLRPFVPGGELAGAFMVMAPPMLMLSALWQIFDGIGLTYSEALRAAGDTAFPMWARGVIAWGIFLPGSWISVRVLGGGERVAMAWLLAYLGLLALALVVRFRGGAWRRIRLVEPAELPVA